MTGQEASSVQEVTNPRAVALLLKDRSRRVLAAFLARENTMTGAARETGLDIRVIHRDVRALLDAGLLTVTRTQPRAGRPVQHYRSSADAYYIDFLDSPAADLAELHAPREDALHGLFHRAAEREFARALHEAGQRWGLHLYPTPTPPHYQVIEGDRHAQHIDTLTQWQGPQARLLSGWPRARLTDAQATELQRDLIVLMRKAAAFDQDNARAEVGANAGAGRPYLLRLGLAPLTEDEAQALHR